MRLPCRGIYLDALFMGLLRAVAGGLDHFFGHVLFGSGQIPYLPCSGADMESAPTVWTK